MKKNEFEFSSLRRRMPPLQAAGLKSAPSPPVPNVNVVPRFVCLCAPVTGSCDFFL